MYLQYKFCENPPSGFWDSAHRRFFTKNLKNVYQMNNLKFLKNLKTSFVLFSIPLFSSPPFHTPDAWVTRSTQRAQTSWAEADHYSHIAHCKNVEPWLWKTTHPPKKKKVLDHYLHHDLGMLPLLWCLFAHLLILQYPDHHQNLISSSLYYSGPVHKISSQSVHNFLSNIVHRQTDRQTERQTNQRYQKHNNEILVSEGW